MTEPTYSYRAFISYRHVERDRRWAKWLINKLESYRTPSHLIDQGIAPRIGKLFRDDDEIPASSNLGTQLEDALKASEFLIVICSPDTPLSEWVRREISFFKALGRADNIIPLLVEGEPDVSFPEELLSITHTRTNAQGDTENYQEKVEPLAADVRLRSDESHQETKQRALIRIAAALLRCGYDALKNREHQRQQKRKRTLYGLTSILIIVLSGLTLFSWYQSQIAQKNAQQAQRERDHALVSQSAFLMKLAADKNKQGHYDTALLLGLNAMPGLYGGKRPLARNLEPLTTAQRLNRKTAHFNHYSNVSKLAYSQNGQLLATSSGDNQYSASVWDIHRGKLMQLQHEGFIYGLAFSPDARLLATSSGDGTAVIWDITTGKKRHTFNYTNLVGHVAFNNDGSVLAVSAYDGTAHLWDTHSAEKRLTLTSEKAIKQIMFNPDNSLIATSSDKSVTLWNSDGEQKFVFERQGVITHINFSPDGQYIAVASRDNSATLWDTKTGEKLFVVGHKKTINHVAFSPDSRYLLTASTDKMAAMWDIEKKEQQLSMQHNGTIKKIIVSTDNRFIATAAYDKTAAIWSATTGERLFTLHHEGNVNDVLFTHDNMSLITASSDNTAALWSLEKRHDLFTLRQSQTTTKTTFSHDGTRLLTIPGGFMLPGKTATLWDSTSGDKQQSFTHEKTILDASFSHDDRLIATTSKDHSAIIWDSVTGKKQQTLDHTHAINSVSFSRDDQFIATGSFDRTAVVWNSLTGEKQQTFTHEDWVQQVIIHPNNRWLITVSGSPVERFAKDNQIAIWDIATGEKRHTIQHLDKKYIKHISLSADGQYLLASALDHSASLWDVASATNIHFFAHNRGVLKAIFHPNKPYIATASIDQSASLWDLDSGEKIYSLQHQGSVIDIDFSHDGRYLASASYDKTVSIWESDTGHHRYTFTHDSLVHDVEFHPKDHAIIAIESKNTTAVWPLNDSANKMIAAAIKSLPEHRLCLSSDERKRYFLPALSDEQKQARGCPQE